MSVDYHFVELGKMKTRYEGEDSFSEFEKMEVEPIVYAAYNKKTLEIDAQDGDGLHVYSDELRDDLLDGWEYRKFKLVPVEETEVYKKINKLFT